MSADQPRFPKLKKCTYWGEGVCADVGCAAQGLMENSADLGDNAEATKRRDQLEADAKNANCGAIPLVRPKFKNS